jgi:glycosyltransferase involved in cell wall biosynthesis
MQSFVEDYGLPESKLTYIGYGINFETVPDVEKNFDSNLALFVGYDFERKGGPTVVEAFQRVREEIRSARLRIIGPAHLDSRYLIEGVEYTPRIQDRQLMQEHFREADFFVMPSLCEPFGLVFLEAMAFKNACIGANQDAMPEIIDHGRTGYRIGAGDVDHLAYVMRQLFRDRGLRRTLGLAAWRDVQSRFTWRKCGDRALSALLTTQQSF